MSSTPFSTVMVLPRRQVVYSGNTTPTLVKGLSRAFTKRQHLVLVDCTIQRTDGEKTLTKKMILPTHFYSTNFLPKPASKASIATEIVTVAISSSDSFL